jgi:hypothetical protein
LSMLAAAAPIVPNVLWKRYGPTTDNTAKADQAQRLHDAALQEVLKQVKMEKTNSSIDAADLMSEIEAS